MVACTFLNCKPCSSITIPISRMMKLMNTFHGFMGDLKLPANNAYDLQSSYDDEQPFNTK